MEKSKPQKVLLLGSGGLRIGQAGEFDYSGSQALKALREEGIATVLVNPNIATVQTDDGMADVVYLQPLECERVTEIIAKEQPDGILLGFGGQTALNLGLVLHERGVLKTYNVEVLGTSVETIKLSEDRELFKKALQDIDVHTPRSVSAVTLEQALDASKQIGFPLMLRAGYSLGGLGSGVISSERELRTRVEEVLTISPQVLLEEYLKGWKEIEYEVVRDCAGNSMTVCNMENMDPMGIHTGESIVVAPSQTLNNEEFHRLREIALRIARKTQVVGECNVQFALHPRTGDYRVIEMNARLSRSSALASKATGYPLAFVAAKLALGKTLDSLHNSITGVTSAFFEPALDYIVVKIPRWDMQKMKTADHTIGTEMKSVGEVMAIGRTFPEALQKGVRMLTIGVAGLTQTKYSFVSLEDEIAHATDHRLFALYEYFKRGGSVARAHQLSNIDRWFLEHIADIARVEEQITHGPKTAHALRMAKEYGFADSVIASVWKTSEMAIRSKRKRYCIIPAIHQIDTLAGEFPAKTNYLYCTYHGIAHDIQTSQKKPIVVLGSGPYSIGSSVEFDWCAVNTVRQLRKSGERAVMINSNPETVSTDYDESDRLYFEELNFERVMDILEFEQPKGVVVSVGGQVAQSLSLPLQRQGVMLYGTSAHSIDMAEDREKFSSLLARLGIDQPRWTRIRNIDSALLWADDIGYPVLVRPSYVLSGAAMTVARTPEDLHQAVEYALRVSPDHPIVLTEFILGAKELEIDGVGDHGEVILEAMAEHIENAGVHSGDATIVLPPQRLYMETIRRTKEIARSLCAALSITGPFNIQFIARNNEIKVIECNIRASRSFPFVSKVTGKNFITIAVDTMLGKHSDVHHDTLDLSHVGVKAPLFSYSRLKGADPVANVEMASTGEVACIGDTALDAYFLSWHALEQRVKTRTLVVSVGSDEAKSKLAKTLAVLEQQGWEIHATDGTHTYLTRNGVGCFFVYKMSEVLQPNIQNLIEQKKVGLIINIPTGSGNNTQTDGYLLRRLATDHHVPLITNLQIARLFLKCVIELHGKPLPLRSWQEYMKKFPISNF
ncbi:carbamoyl-phosphate synthase (glutamine-hydrolyzing) large subunit [Candidatus Uhrbacteria bacterium]|nr:carbamoyl-phosphate synthase (glutamine-hydrolyzing) large subunit [Candidatus Uhrbacteria bacterium]